MQGIALSADPNYKVLGSAYPWIARRLLSDRSTELQDTLRALLYKGSKCAGAGHALSFVCRPPAHRPSLPSCLHGAPLAGILSGRLKLLHLPRA